MSKTFERRSSSVSAKSPTRSTIFCGEPSRLTRGDHRSLREKGHFLPGTKYTPGPAELTFDHDPNPRSPELFMGPGDLHAVLERLFPVAFTGAAHGGYDSSGSFIYDDDGNEVSGRKGFHVVYAVEDATAIVEFGDRLFKRLWLQGYGYIAISKDGKAMPRTIFDKKVIEPQQPLFAGGAHCAGCEQRRPEPTWCDGGYLDLRGVVSLSGEEEREYKRLVGAAKLAVKTECDRAKREYLQNSAADLASTTGVTTATARRVVESRMGGVLVGSDHLHFDDFGRVSVAEVLANPARYDKATLADPIDGDVRGKAMLFMNEESGTPVVFSHAHGGNTYFLKFDLPSVVAWLESKSKDEALDQWPNVLPMAEMRPDELERYLRTVKDRTGLGIASLRSTAKSVMHSAVGAASTPLTEDAGLYLATQLVERGYQGAGIIAVDSGYFWHYTGTHWVQIKESVLQSQLQRIAADQWERLLTMWASLGKKPSTLSSLVSSAVTCVRSLVMVGGDPLRLNSARRSVVNCVNGELWLTADGPDLRPHRPESYLTSCTDIPFDPQAVAPTFDEAMRGILSLPGGNPMPDQDDMLRHVEELLGYTVQTRRNLKTFVLITGPGDNGKTKIVRLLGLILGNDAIAFDRLAGVDESGNRFAAARLVGKLALIDDDGEFEYLLPDGLLKKIAEEKPLTAEGKFKDPFQFVAQVVPWLLSNSWPRTRDLTRGMQTRANVLYFPRSFLKPSECGEQHPDRQRPGLWDKVYSEEMAGVLNRLVAAYYRVVAREGFLPPESAKKAFDLWLSEANVVARFLADACEAIEPSKPGCTTGAAYAAFIFWCDENGVQQRHRPQLNQFKRRLQDISVRVEHVEVGSGVFGYRLKKEWSVGNGQLPERATAALPTKAARKN